MKKNKNHILFFVVFLLLLAAGSKQLISQVSCEIEISVPTPVCPGTDFKLSVLELDNQVYEWSKNNIILTGLTTVEILVKIDTTSSFTVKTTDTITGETCTSEAFVVDAYPKINIAFNQVQLTCSNGDNDNGNTAQVIATASGAFEPDQYHYFWNVAPLQLAPGDSSMAIGLKANLNYSITVKDNFGCAAKDTVRTKAYNNPVMEIFYDPNDTIYIQNPFVTFSFNNLSADSVTLTNFFWDFGDCDPLTDPLCEQNISRTFEMPTHEYSLPLKSDTTYYPTLTVYNQQGCDTIYSGMVLVKIVKLFIPNIFTPNGDASNQYFEITLDEANRDITKSINLFYERSELTIINRQGRIVFQSNDYQNDWDGEKLPDGVYFYILKCFGAISNDVFKGSVTIYGSGR